ncbi:hypothetical protein J5X84_15135 [Streptosporangiaceae bacterium NEAU-GS5]|nr:hypothetical protein [Streptosporangiaceae bacterium NEAU-GS5]
MSDLLSELGKKLADRWLTAVLLPGLLATAVAVCGHILGHQDAFNVDRLSAGIQDLIDGLNVRPPATTVVVAALALVAASGAGLAAQALGVTVHKVLTSTRPHWWVGLRRRRAPRVTRAGDPRPESYLPTRISPVGDRFQLISPRINAQYGLDVTLAWPRIWLLLPEAARSEIGDGYASYRAATMLTGWGLLYVALGSIWWPASVAGAVILVVGYRRVADAGLVVADVIESAVDLYAKPLADAVGIPLPNERVTPVQGSQINNVLNKRA